MKPTAVLDALPGLGKTTAALAFGQAFHRAQIECYGPQVDVGGGRWQRIPVVYLGLTSNTTMRSLNAMLCRFYGLPGAERGTADWLAQRAAECVANCKTRLVIVDDVHFLDVNRRDGREVANHFKWLANTFPVTFLFVGRRTARPRTAWTRDCPGPTPRSPRRHGAGACGASIPSRSPPRPDGPPGASCCSASNASWCSPGCTGAWSARDLSDYLFARSSGHFASLMSLISRGCYRAVKTGTEALTAELLDTVRIDQAAEAAREHLHAALAAGLLSAGAKPLRREGAA